MAPVDSFDPFAGPAVERVVATSEAQREVWLAAQLGRDASLAFNESIALKLVGELDETALQGALASLLRRHESLRSTLSPDGTEMLIGGATEFAAASFDLRNLSPQARREALADAGEQEVDTPFDLEQGPLVRAALFRTDEREHVLLLSAHHIVCDGWSFGRVKQDLGALYSEQIGAAPAGEPATQYADYVAWENAQAATPEMTAHRRYWVERFAGGSLPVLELPLDRPRAARRSFRSARVDRMIDAQLLAGLRKLGGRAGASIFGTLFTGFAALLHRLTAQDDLVIGVPAAGQSASGLLDVVGHCVNLLPIRVAVDRDAPFQALLTRTASVMLDAFEHQTYTYGSLLKELPVRRDASRLPLVSAMFNIDLAPPGAATAFDGLQASHTAVARRFENFELFVNGASCDGGLRLECQYNADLFDARTVDRWLAAYETLLRDAVADAERPVGRLALLSPADQAALRALQPMPQAEPAEPLMHAALLRHCREAPQRTAVRFEGLSLSYGELDARSEQLARALRERGIGRGARVGLCLPRGFDMIVALLGVLRSGATYVPLDPSFPTQRLEFYAQDAGLALLITHADVAAAPRAWCPDAADRVLELDRVDLAAAGLSQAPLDAPRADDVAYVIYTSGSTGRPKGVCVPHRAVANFLASMAREPGLGAGDRLAAVTTLSFDIAVLELLLPLSVGAEVVLVSRETMMDGAALATLLRESRATVMQATPGLWRLLIDAGWQGGPHFKALVGGEALPADLALRLLESAGSVWNLYGPTETTVWSTAWQVTRAGLAAHGVSIGRPIANTSVWVLDEHGQRCPVGVPGELCIGGSGVAIGYLDRPELTTDRFVDDGPSGQRLYRTGDRGRWRNEGLLEHLGRLDFQVKLRGYRIELGEVEAACLRLDGVSDCVALVREDQPGDQRLVVYLQGSGLLDVRPHVASLLPPGTWKGPFVALGAATVLGRPGDSCLPDDATLRTQLAATLPDYMLPQHAVRLQALPRLPNGKLDRRALPAPDQAAPAAPGAEHVAARDPLEASVLAAMESVLRLPGLGVHDDFFALGGHSLLAARLAARLGRDLDMTLPLRHVFEAPTAARLARAIVGLRSAGASPRAPLGHRPDRHTAPLTPMQERIRFVEELHPDRVLYSIPSARRLSGPLDAERLANALRKVVQRQPALRTAIVSDGAGAPARQRIAAHVDVAMPVEDLRDVPDAQRHEELLRHMQVVIDTPMPLDEAPLFRAVLYRLADDEHGFLMVVHHIVWDGGSFDLFYAELAAAYEAPDSYAPAPLAATYGDYAEWLAEWLEGDESRAQLGYWRQRFAVARPVAALRTDRPRRAGMSGEGATCAVRIDATLTGRLRTVAREAGVTLSMLTLATYAAMMARLADGRSTVIGLPVRGRAQAELEPVMGFFNNLLPLQVDVDAEGAPQRPFAELLGVVKRDLLDAFSHQDIPFERMTLEPEGGGRRAGMPYHALFSFQDARERPRRWGDVETSSLLVFQSGATEDLGLWLNEVPDGLEGGLTYNADLYTHETAQALNERYAELLEGLAAQPATTLGELLRADGSAAAQHLQRLAGSGAPASRAAVSAPAVDSAAPMTPDELALAKVWGSLLGIDAAQLRGQDSFFDVGGDSLLAMRAVEQSAKALGFRVEPRRYVFESLAQLASREAHAERKPPAAAGRGLLGRAVRALGGRFARPSGDA